MKTDFPTTTIATVYKTLVVLKSTGEVLELEFSGDYNRYDGKKPGPHPHLICIKCKRIVDPDMTSLAEMTEKLALESGYEIVSHRLDFYGICPECQQKGPATRPFLKTVSDGWKPDAVKTHATKHAKASRDPC